MTRARSLVTGAVVLLSAVLVGGCGKPLAACSAKAGNCGDVAGSYAVSSSQIQGKCDFTPYTLPSTIVVQQTADKSQVTVGVLDQVNQQTLDMSGPLYAKDSSTPYSVGTISLTQQTVRLATRTSSNSVNLQVTFSASVAGDGSPAQNYILGGSLTTTSIPSAAGSTACSATVTFSASRPAG